MAAFLGVDVTRPGVRLVVVMVDFFATDVGLPGFLSDLAAAGDLLAAAAALTGFFSFSAAASCFLTAAAALAGFFSFSAAASCFFTDAAPVGGFLSFSAGLPCLETSLDGGAAFSVDFSGQRQERRFPEVVGIAWLCRCRRAIYPTGRGASSVVEATGMLLCWRFQGPALPSCPSEPALGNHHQSPRKISWNQNRCQPWPPSPYSRPPPYHSG